LIGYLLHPNEAPSCRLTNLYDAIASRALATAMLPSKHPKATFSTSLETARHDTRRLTLPKADTEKDSSSKLPKDGMKMI
jgi:hypothetical protein